MLRFKDLYNNVVRAELKKKFGYKNVHQIPTLIKIVVNMGVGEVVANSKIFDYAVQDLKMITGQHPLTIKAKKSVSSFKLRQGVNLGCKVTLRNDRMYDFLERLVFMALPRSREFKGFRKKNFDGRGNLNFGIKEQIVFSEINYDNIDQIRGMNVTIVTSTNNQEEAKALLSRLSFPFIY